MTARLFDPLERARRRYLTRELRAELHAAEEERLRAVSAARVLELMLAEGPTVNMIRARNARELLSAYRTRYMGAR